MPMNILECFTICRTPCCMLRVELSISSSHQSLKQRLPYPYLPDEKAEVSQGHFQGQTASSRREDSVSLGGVGPRAAARGHFSLLPHSSPVSCSRGHMPRARSQTSPQVTGAAMGPPLCQDHLMRIHLFLPCVLRTAP